MLFFSEKAFLRCFSGLHGNFDFFQLAHEQKLPCCAHFFGFTWILSTFSLRTSKNFHVGLSFSVLHGSFGYVQLAHEQKLPCWSQFFGFTWKFWLRSAGA